MKEKNHKRTSHRKILQLFMQVIHIIFHWPERGLPQGRVLLSCIFRKSASGKDDKKQGLSRLSLHIVEKLPARMGEEPCVPVEKCQRESPFSAWLKQQTCKQWLKKDNKMVSKTRIMQTMTSPAEPLSAGKPCDMPPAP